MTVHVGQAAVDAVVSHGESLVIDTENKFLSSGLASELAHRAGGHYYYLPKAMDRTIAAMARAALHSG